MAAAVTGVTGILTKPQGLTRSISLVRMMSGTAATGTPGEGAGKGGGTGGKLRGLTLFCLGFFAWHCRRTNNEIYIY